MGSFTTPTNTRINNDVCKAIECLAYLTEYHQVGSDLENVQPLLRNLTESGEAYLIEHADQLNSVVNTRLQQLENWRPCANGKEMNQQTKVLVEQTLVCVSFLRAKGF
jgi:hypothetical protein